MQEIQHIIFDLGGVLLNIDYLKTEQAFTTQLGVKDFATMYSQFHASALFEDLETGSIGPEVFLETLKKHVAGPHGEEDIVNAWNAMLLDFPIGRLRLLQRLQPHYDLYLLSNTNAIHKEAFEKILTDSHGIPSLDGFFRKAYYSHLMGKRKPDEAAFEQALGENKLDPQRTLFIDDTFLNIEAAAKLGMKTIWLKPPLDVRELFEERSSSRSEIVIKESYFTSS